MNSTGFGSIMVGILVFMAMILGGYITTDTSVNDISDYSLTYEIKTISSDAEVVFGESTVKGIGEDEMSFKAEDYSVGDKVRVYFDEDGKVVRKVEVD